MARIRSVKPELRTSLTVAAWPREVRYAWVLLWGYLDDHGRGVDDMRLVVSDLFPLDRDVTERKMDNWLKLMAAGDDPALCRYTVAGRRYMHATKWDHQKVYHPKRSRIPPCPRHESSRSAPEPDPKNSGSPPESFGRSSGDEPENLGNGSGAGAYARYTPALHTREPRDQGNKGSRDRGIEGRVRARPRSTTDERVEQAINAGRDVQAWVDAGGLRAIEGGAS